MSETKHTPLPWRTISNKSVYIEGGLNSYVASTDGDSGQGEKDQANAQLIVTSVNARPKVEELVEAAKPFVFDRPRHTKSEFARLEAAIREVEAALKGEA